MRFSARYFGKIAGGSLHSCSEGGLRYDLGFSRCRVTPNYEHWGSRGTLGVEAHRRI